MKYSDSDIEDVLDWEIKGKIVKAWDSTYNNVPLIVAFNKDNVKDLDKLKKNLIAIYNMGYEHGRVDGETKLKEKFRKLFNLAEDDS